MADQIVEDILPFKITYEDGTNSDSLKQNYTGKAEIEYPNRDKFSGNFVNGVKDGQGRYDFYSGDFYEGDWKNNKQDGIGKTVYRKGDFELGSYCGKYANGVREGDGVFKFSNGDIYSGQWKNNLKHGKGTYIVNDCKLEENQYMKIVGEWENGEITSGKWLFPNGTYFEGSFEKNLPKGEGNWVFENGNKNNGIYKHSEARIGNKGEISTKLTWTTKEEIFDPRIHCISGK